MTSSGGRSFRPRRARPVEELLLAATAAACRRQPDPRLTELVARASDDVFRDLPALAFAHRVDGCVHFGLEQVGGVPVDVLEQLADSRRHAAAHHLLVRDVMARVGAVLEAAGIPWLVFKGPALSSLVYCDPGLRRYSDLDVLVPPGRFADAVAAMDGAGFGNSVTLWSPQVHFRSGALAFAVGGISVDLHWHVMYKYQDRREFRIDPEVLFERRRVVDIGGRPVSTFDAIDTVFHLALHAAREGCHRLVWMKDIELAVAALGDQARRPDFDELVRRSRAAGCAPAVGIALARSKWALGAAVPDDIVAALVGRVWPTVVRAAVSFDDLGSTSQRASLGTVLTRQTRMSLPRTAAATIRRIRERRDERRIARVLREGFDPNDANPQELARNATDRATYFALVRNWRSELH